jgi:hypothetical protein
MKVERGAVVEIVSFLPWVLKGDELSALGPGCFTPFTDTIAKFADAEIGLQCSN